MTAEEDETDQFIKVCIRIRPPDYNLDKLGNICIKASGKNVILCTSKAADKIFSFDHVADEDATQESLFRTVGKHLIEGCFDGYNGTIFAYGQTGSGKTYTMQGPDATNVENDQSHGLIPRCLNYLFSLVDRKKSVGGDTITFLCKCSFVEIYQELVFDLLDGAGTSLQIRENIKYGTFVEGVTESEISSAAEAADILQRGWTNRKVASTSMNRESSRSHALFTLHLESREKINEVVNIRTSQLNLVDLAGSERQKDTNATDSRLKEAGSINKTLSVLGNVMTALLHRNQGKIRHVPYRDSKLTFLLRDSLGGNARTCIIATIHPNAKCFGETLSTLQFAQRAKLVRNRAMVNEDISASSVPALQAEIIRLRKLLNDNRTSSLPLRKPDQDKYSAEVSTAEETIKKLEEEKTKLLKLIDAYKEAYGKNEKNYLSSKLLIKLRESRIQALEMKLKERNVAHEQKNQAIATPEKANCNDKPALSESFSELDLKQESDELKQLRRQSNICVLQHGLLKTDKGHSLSALAEQFEAECNIKDQDDFTLPSVLNIPEPDDLRLNKELTTVRAENEDLKKENACLACEIKALNSNVFELKTALRASRFQREILNEMHMSSIQALTPPRCSTISRKDRRRTVYTPGPIKGCEDDIPPLELNDEQYLKLTKEQLIETINDIKAVNLELEKKSEGLQRDVLNFEAEQNCLNQILNDQRKKVDEVNADFSNKEAKLCQKIAELQIEALNTRQEAEFSSSEASDLKVLLDFNEKKMVEMKSSMEVLKKSQEPTADISLEIKVSQLEKTIVELLTEREMDNEEKENLYNRIEVSEAQNQFNSDLMQDLEDRILAEEEKCRNAYSQLELKTRRSDELSALCTELSTVKTQQHDTLTEKNLRLQNEIAQLTHLLGTESHAFHMEKQTSHNLKTELEIMKNEVNELKTQCELLAQSVEEANVQKMTALSELAGKENQYGTLLNAYEMEKKSFRIEKDSLEHLLSHYGIKVLNRDKVSNGVKEEIADPSDLTQALKEKSVELQNLRDKLAYSDTLIEDLHNQRSEKNLEVDRLRSELMSIQDACNVDLADMRLEKAEMRDLMIKYQSNITELKLKYCALEDEHSVYSCQYDKLNGEHNRVLDQFQEMEKQRQRFIVAEQDLFSENEVLKSQIREMEENIANLKQRLSAEEKENVKLVGHANKKQKIHYVEILRNEAVSLRQRVRELEKENEQLTLVNRGSSERMNLSNSNNRKLSR